MNHACSHVLMIANSFCCCSWDGYCLPSYSRYREEPDRPLLQHAHTLFNLSGRALLRSMVNLLPKVSGNARDIPLRSNRISLRGAGWLAVLAPRAAAYAQGPMLVPC